MDEFHEMFLSDFSHTLENIGTNNMSDDSSAVLLLHFMIFINFSYGVGFRYFFNRGRNQSDRPVVQNTQ